MQKASSKLLYDYWNSLRGSRSAPDRRDIDPTQIRGALSNAFILEREGDGDFVFRLAGAHLCSAYCRELKGRSFLANWHARDRDAVETMIRAATEDHAAALLNFTATNGVGGKTQFETLLLPLRHNGSTESRLLGSMAAVHEPYWFGVQPIEEQRVTGLRLIWPDDLDTLDAPPDLNVAVNQSNFGGSFSTPALVQGQSARRYAHLAVITGGKS